MRQEINVLESQSSNLFANYCRNKLQTSPEFLRILVVIDECKFPLSRFVNKQNIRAWGSERPNETYQLPNNGTSVMTWCAVTEEVNWSFFFEI